MKKALIPLPIILLFLLTACQDTTSVKKLPNFVIIFCDDLGYGDIGPFGHPTIRTPNLDRMASEGQRWTSFYVAASVCTPSRAGLMTGRLPIRSGMCDDRHRVLFPNSTGGLPQSEITLAEALKQGGYTTACIGKWHLGHHPEYLPTNNGFDYYYGIPYSNDMDRETRGDQYVYNVPLHRNLEIIERPADQPTLTKRYTEESVKFIRENRDRHFFLYLAHTMPHIPLFRSQDFEDVSLRGLFGDVIEEIDWSTGEIIKALKDEGIEKNTLVLFTSDNGPWAIMKLDGGSPGILTGEKGATFEGGMREPTLFWWPGRIEPGTVMDIGTTMDIFPTFCRLAGVEVPSDRIYDGGDISPALFGTGPSGRDVVFYYRGTRIFAVRKGPYKAHFITKSAYGRDDEVQHDPPLLYHLEHDPSELYNIAEQHPGVIEDIRAEVEKHQQSLEPVKNQLEERITQQD
jgi:arylsulfatase A-like enzyme